MDQLSKVNNDDTKPEELNVTNATTEFLELADPNVTNTNTEVCELQRKLRISYYSIKICDNFKAN